MEIRGIAVKPGIVNKKYEMQLRTTWSTAKCNFV